MAQFSTDLFAYDPTNKSFSTEASTLGLPVGSILTDFHIKSSRTGKLRDFTLSKTEKDEGDVRYWLYRGEDDMTAIIFND